VALRVLPADPRRHLRAVYAVTRMIDDAGDGPTPAAAYGDRGLAADRIARLTALRRDLEEVWAGSVPHDPVLRTFADTVVACGLSRQPFVDLVAANLLDQTITTYATFADLAGYCALSANPVGRMVLEIFGAATPRRLAWSDRICTALQVIEHCQDVVEDRRAGRVYLPLCDLDRFGVTPADFESSRPRAAVRHLIAFESARARSLLESGRPLLRELTGWARLAVAGYMAGGRAALAALERGGWVNWPTPARVRWVDVAGHLAVLWCSATLAARGGRAGSVGRPEGR
jgi:squalene synthase HpnC